MAKSKYPAVEPLWPFGSIAYFFTRQTSTGPEVETRQLQVIRATKRWSGWRVLVQLPATKDQAATTTSFNVNNKGVSSECMPWTQEHEDRYNVSAASKYVDRIRQDLAKRRAAQQEARENQILTKTFAPFWPRGTVGRFYVKQDPAWGDAQGLMAVEQLPILNIRRIDTGYVLLVGAKGEYLFEVDQNGESNECVPWDDEMQREFDLHGEDILPSYDMPEPVDEPEPAKTADVLEPVGIVTQTDSGLHSSGPRPQQYLVPVADKELSDEVAEVQEAETVGAGTRRQRFTEAAGTKPKRLSEPGLSKAEAEAVESFVDAENRQEADK